MTNKRSIWYSLYALIGEPGTDADFVSITLHGLIIDTKMLSLINQIGNERLETLSTADFLVINTLYHGLDLTANLKLHLKHLMDIGIVEHIGRNKYVLARSLYTAAGKSGIHTRIVGLDRETNMELLFEKMGRKEHPSKSCSRFFRGTIEDRSRCL